MKTVTKKSRREFIKTGTLAAAGAMSLLSLNWKTASAATPFVDESFLPGDEGGFKLAPLPYAYNALEPYIDAKTMEIHYSKHHQGYVDKLNAAIEKAPELKGRSLEDLIKNIDKLPEGSRNAIRNQGGGNWNHTFFWQVIGPKSDALPTGKLKDAMVSKWETIDKFKEEFSKAGMGVFGSGWVWVVADNGGKLSIVTTPNQDNTLMDISKDQGKPILGIDVWEHAYYLKHQNKRVDYLNDIWNVVNWKKVTELYG
ncbi:MAG: superoxide dismutase [Chitinophagales bacterium]